MERLIEGHRHFREDIFPQRRDQFHLLAESQAPRWLFITCSDSRIVPDLILQTGPGDLFITRNAGNIIPLATVEDGATATIEYAVEVLHVKHAIVCGHSDCGALKAALNRPDPARMPLASRWLAHVDEAFDYRQPLNPADGEHAELASLVRGNVIAQLENLKRQPSVAGAMSRGEMDVHGWYYDILAGMIEEYVDAERKFLPLLELPKIK